MAKIGFLGHGNMGLPMAQILVKAGHHVCGFDVNAAAIDRFAAGGGAVARSLALAAADVDTLCLLYT
jgi:3-hydroxyisobutyrate dehydrogenase